MRLYSLITCFLIALLSPLVAGVRKIESDALTLCSGDNVPQNFTATYFSVTFTPGNRSLSFSFDGVSSIEGKVQAEMSITAYGYEALNKKLDPCKMKLNGLCPMHTGAIDIQNAHIQLPEDVVAKIPGKPSRRIDWAWS